MAQTFAQTQLTPMNVGGGDFKVPSIAALGQGFKDLGAAAAKPAQTPGTYVDPVTGQLMLGVAPGANGQPGAPMGYDWNNDATAVGSSAWRLKNDPGWYRPDGGGR